MKSLIYFIGLLIFVQFSGAIYVFRPPKFVEFRIIRTVEKPKFNYYKNPIISMVMGQPVQPFNFGIGPISYHAWNKDRSQVAVSPNNNSVYILAWRGGKWDKCHILSEHDMPITGIDWAPNTNRIVTCSQDKDVFVWTFDGKVWKPELVVVRLPKGCTCVKWSPLENKFAVGSNAKIVAVCYFEKANDWWVARQIKKPMKSTVTSIDWHPNNVLLAVGCCDFKARVFSTFIKGIDDQPAPCPWGSKVGQLGHIVAEHSSKGGGWVHCVQFSPSGNRLAWVGHDSSISVVDANSSSPQDDCSVRSVGVITVLKDWFLPFTTIQWVSENSIVAAGHDYCPMLFSFTRPGELKFVSKLDMPAEQKEMKMSALDKFRHLDKKAEGTSETILKTLHQNLITQVLPHAQQGANIAKFSTCALDGQLILWDLKSLQATQASVIVS